MSSSEDDAPLMRVNGRGKGAFLGLFGCDYAPLQFVADLRFPCTSSSHFYISSTSYAIVLSL
jgi:hypothetical protein